MDEASAAPNSPPAPTPSRFLRRVLIAVGIVVLVAIVAVTFGFAWSGILTICGGVLVGVLLDGLACRIAGWTHMPRWLALLLVCLLVVGAFVAMGFWVAPALSDEIDDLREQVPQAWQDFMEWMRAQPWGPEALERVSEVDPSTLVSPKFGGWLSTTAGTIGSLLLMVVFGLYLAADPDIYMRGVAYLVPPQHRPRAFRLMSHIGQALRSWLVGRFISMAVVGVGTAVGLWAVGVPLAVPLGVLAGLLSFVPNLGPILAAVPGILMGFTVGPDVALYALAVYGGIQLVESYLLAPVVQQKAVSLPPALLLSFQMLMGISAGVTGLFMATPILVALVVIVQSLYLRDLFHDDITIIGEPKKDHHEHPVRRWLSRRFRRAKR